MGRSGRWSVPAGVLCLALAGGASAAPPAKPLPLPEYQSSSNCRICHERIFEQHQASRHARSFANPLFLAQYFREVVPPALADASLAREGNRCVACHSPLTFIKAKGREGPIREFDPTLAGVVCDFCHRVGAYKDARPFGGNFMSSPGDKKFGPFKQSSDWHHVFHELQTRSELCAICHEDVNRGGLAVKTTYSEWQASAYAAEGIQCQDCHMSLHGFLAGDRPVFESGKAAAMPLGGPADRSTLYTHRFPGAHESAQVEGAIALRIGFEPAAAAAGEEVAVVVEVENRRAGHAIPTGSADLRLLWMEVAAAVEGTVTPLAAGPARAGIPHDVAGAGPFDAAILGGDVPAGSRLYRAVYVDAGGVQTLSSAAATAIPFDNRLRPREPRRERYRFALPAAAPGPVVLLARVYYLAYPAAFARALGVEPAAPQLIAEARAAFPAGPVEPR